MKYAIYALLLSAAVTMVSGPVLIPLLHKLKFGQSERKLGPETHLKKAGTPTMGGITFILGIVAATMIFAYSASELVMPALLMTVAFALVGFMDDFLKVKKHNTDGLRAYQKIIAQFLIALIIAVYAQRSPFIGTSIYLPFSKVEWELGAFYIPVIVFVIIGTVNAVNLTDGLDGLASGVSLVYSMAMTVIFLYMASIMDAPVDMGQARQTQYAAELNSMAVFAAAVAGGCLGFLRFNSFPAKVFMGDTGSLALGGFVASAAYMMRLPLFIPIIGLIYLVEVLSVIIQVTYFKKTGGKRIFKMAPIHHHFELCGWSETRVVAVFSIVTALLCMIAYLGL